MKLVGLGLISLRPKFEQDTNHNMSRFIMFQEWQENYQNGNFSNILILLSKPWLMADSCHICSPLHPYINTIQNQKQGTHTYCLSKLHEKIIKVVKLPKSFLHPNQYFIRILETPMSLFQSISTPEVPRS